MALTDGLKNIAGNTINLPLIGAVSVPVVIGIGLLLFMTLRKKRVTSVTTRYGR